MRRVEMALPAALALLWVALALAFGLYCATGRGWLAAATASGLVTLPVQAGTLLGMLRVEARRRG